MGIRLVSRVEQDRLYLQGPSRAISCFRCRNKAECNVSLRIIRSRYVLNILRHHTKRDLGHSQPRRAEVDVLHLALSIFDHLVEAVGVL